MPWADATTTPRTAAQLEASVRTYADTKMSTLSLGFIDVKKDFGAVGDGVVDDTTALQNALNATTATRCIVYFPPGTYKITSGLTCNTNNLEMFGQGMIGMSALLGLGATVIKVPAGVVGFTFGDGTVSRFAGPTIRNLHFQDTSGTATGGIWLRRVNNWFLDRVACSGFLAGYGVFSDGTGNVNQYGTLRDCSLNKCMIALDQLLTIGTIIDGGQWDADDNGAGGASVLTGATAVRHRSGDTFRAFALRTSFYDIHYDLQAGQGHHIEAPRIEGFGTGVKNAALDTMILGGLYNNSVLGGGVGTAVDNQAAADGLTFMPGSLGSMLTNLADAGTNTTYKNKLTWTLPQSGEFKVGSARLTSPAAGNMMCSTGYLAAHSHIWVDKDDQSGKLLFGSLQDTNLYRAGADRLQTDDVLTVLKAVTGSRPSAATVGAGAQMYDTTIAQPIWSDGANWKQAAPVDIQVFTSSGTWTRPTGVTMVMAIVVGGGGGGGSGRRGAATTIRGGGGGGGAGGRTVIQLPAAAVGATETVTVGGAATGAAAITADDTSGGAGNPGVTSTFGGHARGVNGTGGGGGTAGAGTAGGSGVGQFTGGAGAASSATGAVGTQPASSNDAPGGGGSGGGVTSGDAPSNGGAGGTINANPTAGGTAGVSPGGAGSAGTSMPSNSGRPGLGGGGGASSITGAAGAGGNGGSYGAGGGGGGASLNGNNSGAGGNGSPGIVVVISW